MRASLKGSDWKRLYYKNLREKTSKYNYEKQQLNRLNYCAKYVSFK